MPDVSPPWWNLGHTTWFFAKNVLEPHGLYRPEDARLEYVLNSYYEILGPRVDRTERGLQTRPTTEEIYAFRERTDERLERLLAEVSDEKWDETEFLITTGIQHEQQHQELFVTEIKHILGSNAPELREAYLAPQTRTRRGVVLRLDLARCQARRGAARAQRRRRRPRQQRAEADRARRGARPVRQPRGRLVLRQRARRAQGVDRPVRGRRSAGDQPRLPRVHGATAATAIRCSGWRTDGPRCAIVASRRRSTGSAWTAVAAVDARGHAPGRPRRAGLPRELLRSGRFRAVAGSRASRVVGLSTSHRARVGARGAVAGVRDRGGELPREREAPPGEGQRLRADACNGEWSQAAGEVWEWTSSHYEAYPGYVPFDGALTEYNGKFMDNQRVLRGGSCATPRSHIRVSYRNFWAPDTRFQFTGIRLARPQSAAKNP